MLETWEGYYIDYRVGSSLYQLRVVASAGAAHWTFDGVASVERSLQLIEEHWVHEVEIAAGGGRAVNSSGLLSPTEASEVNLLLHHPNNTTP